MASKEKFIGFNLRLTKDPEVKDGRVTFRVAANRKSKGVDVATFYTVSSGQVKIAEIIGKGCLVSVEGRLEISEFNGKTNQTVWADDIHIHTFKDKKDNSSDASPPSTASTDPDF